LQQFANAIEALEIWAALSIPLASMRCRHWGMKYTVKSDG